MESHLCRHWEEQCRPGKLATVFCKEMTHAPPQLPPSRSNSQSWPPVTPDAPPLSCRWAYLPSLRTGQAKSLSLSEVDGTNLNADIKAKIVFNRQIKFFFLFCWLKLSHHPTANEDLTCSRAAVPNFLGTRDRFRGRQFFQERGRVVVSGWFKYITFMAHLTSVIIILWNLLFSHQVSDSLWPHGLKHARLPYPSLSPGVFANLCLLSQRCYPTISSSVTPFSHLQSFPASGSLLMSRLFASGSQNTGASVSASVLPINTQGWFPLWLNDLISLQSKGLSRVFSSTTTFFIQLTIMKISGSPELVCFLQLDGPSGGDGRQ